MKKSITFVIAILIIFTLTACRKSESPRTLLSDLGIGTIENIDSCTVLYDDNGQDVVIKDREDYSFLIGCTYAYELPTDRTHELYLFPDTRTIKLKFDENAKTLYLLKSGEIVLRDDAAGCYRVYQTAEPEITSRENFSKVIKKYGGYIDESTVQEEHSDLISSITEKPLQNSSRTSSLSENNVVSSASRTENSSKAQSSSKVENSSKAQSSSKENNLTSDLTTGEAVRPETVIQTYPFENKFKMPESLKTVFYDRENGNRLPYRLFVPQNYSESNQYPVILFLHGAGEVGTDNTLQLNHIDKIFQYNGDFAANAFIICPQSYEWWNLDRNLTGDQKGTLGSALHLLEEIMQNYSCDRNRVYVTGLSMGGYATWSLLEEYGSIFATGVPICGGGNPYNGAALKNIPIRIYHGTADTTVPFSASQSMYHAIVNAGGQKVKFIELSGVGHDAWSHAFADRDMFSWLFAQNKATNPTCQYEYVSYFCVKDSDGKTIISDKDMVKASYDYGSEDEEDIVLDLALTAGGIDRLKKAYISSGGKPFTFYWGNQKAYSFIATKAPIDNVFRIDSIFDYSDFLDFYKQLLSLKQKKTP